MLSVITSEITASRDIFHKSGEPHFQLRWDETIQSHPSNTHFVDHLVFIWGFEPPHATDITDRLARGTIAHGFLMQKEPPELQYG